MSKKQPKTVTIFVTSRALTEGIVKLEARPIANLPNYMEGLALGPNGERGRTHWYGPGSYRLTVAEAVVRAKAMQAKRIVRMEKQLAEIRALTFEEIPHET